MIVLTVGGLFAGLVALVFFVVPKQYVPWWSLPAIIVSAFMLEMWGYWMQNREKRFLQSRGLWCEACGYDLTRTPDKCPMCGVVPAKKKIIQTESGA